MTLLTMVLAIVPFASSFAQDDVYFTPKKKKAVTQPSEVVDTPTNTPQTPTDEEWYVGRSSHIDVDSYNRRYTKVNTNDLQLPDSVYYMEPEDCYEYTPTSSLIRFHGYYDPWYYSPLDWNYYYGSSYDWFYDPWYYGAWGRHGWHYTYSWASPWYGYYHPWSYYGWHNPWYGYHAYHPHVTHRNSDGTYGYQNRGGRGSGIRTTTATHSPRTGGTSYSGGFRTPGRVSNPGRTSTTTPNRSTAPRTSVTVPARSTNVRSGFTGSQGRGSVSITPNRATQGSTERSIPLNSGSTTHHNSGSSNGFSGSSRSGGNSGGSYSGGFSGGSRGGGFSGGSRGSAGRR